MISLGAHAVVEHGEGDDDEDIEADFDKWREQLFAALDKSKLVGGSQLSKVESRESPWMAHLLNSKIGGEQVLCCCKCSAS